MIYRMDGTRTSAPLVFEVTHEGQAESREVINRGLSEFNAKHLGDHKWTGLDVYVRDATGQLVAGLIGECVLDLLYVHTLWVTESLRGRGLGTRILKAAEDDALQRGCRVVVLNTLSFQAPAFYQKLGYERTGVTEFQPGVQKIYMQKRLLAR